MASQLSAASALLFALLLATSHGAIVTLIAKEPCERVSDCMHGFPATASTLSCKNKLCAANQEKFCVDHLDCGALLSCASGHCTHGALGAPCDSRASCGIGLYCTRGRCVHGLRGAPCTLATALECGNGFTCLPATGSHPTCAPGVLHAPCVLDRNCAMGLRCSAGRCAIGVRPDIPAFHPWDALRASPPPSYVTPHADTSQDVVVSAAAAQAADAAEPSAAPFVLEPSAEPVPVADVGPLPEPSAMLVAPPPGTRSSFMQASPEPLSGPIEVHIGASEAPLLTALPIPDEIPNGNAHMASGDAPHVLIVMRAAVQ